MISSTRETHIFNIFTDNEIFKYKLFISKDYFKIEKDNFIVFSNPGLYIIYISYNGMNIYPAEGKMEDLFLKYDYKTKNNKTKEFTQDLSQQPFKIMFDIITNDCLFFSVSSSRPKIIQSLWQVKILS